MSFAANLGSRSSFLDESINFITTVSTQIQVVGLLGPIININVQRELGDVLMHEGITHSRMLHRIVDKQRRCYHAAGNYSLAARAYARAHAVDRRSSGTECAESCDLHRSTALPTRCTHLFQAARAGGDAQTPARRRRRRPAGLSAWEHAALAVRLADAARLSGQACRPRPLRTRPPNQPRDARPCPSSPLQIRFRKI